MVNDIESSWLTVQVLQHCASKYSDEVTQANSLASEANNFICMQLISKQLVPFPYFYLCRHTHVKYHFQIRQFHIKELLKEGPDLLRYVPTHSHSHRASALYYIWMKWAGFFNILCHFCSLLGKPACPETLAHEERQQTWGKKDETSQIPERWSWPASFTSNALSSQ